MKTNRYLLISLSFLLIFVFACSNSDNSNKNEYWTCTMHPQVHKDGPGACPICGMDLIKKIIDDTTNGSDTSDMEGMLTRTTDKQVLANVSTGKMKNDRLDKELSA